MADETDAGCQIVIRQNRKLASFLLLFGWAVVLSMMLKIDFPDGLQNEWRFVFGQKAETSTNLTEVTELDEKTDLVAYSYLVDGHEYWGHSLCYVCSLKSGETVPVEYVVGFPEISGCVGMKRHQHPIAGIIHLPLAAIAWATFLFFLCRFIVRLLMRGISALSAVK